MGACPNVLFDYLCNDLSNGLPGIDAGFLLRDNNRDRSWPDISDREAAGLCLADSLLKKYRADGSNEADSKALTKFLECNDACQSFASIDETQTTEIEAVCIGELKKEVYNFFHDSYGVPLLSCDDCITQNMRTGPGASVGVKGTSHYEKVMSGKLTGTRKLLYSLYQREVQRDPLWKSAEAIRHEHFGGFVEVPGSVLSYVPKNALISRTICTEPSLNMLLQQGVAFLLEERLLQRRGINLRKRSDQYNDAVQADKNRQLARMGSVSGRYGTIDLSSASDTISLGLVKQLLPRETFKRLMELRSSQVTLPDGKVVPLHMVSSMGNAFTFPLQTILFSSVVIAVYNSLGLKVVHPRGKALGNYAVFGDDIIVAHEAYNLVCRTLQRCGFRVNLDKSYNEGPFRESCGADFWRGYPVRGVYCQRLKTRQDVYSLINRLNVWSANHAVPLPDSIQYLLSCVPGYNPVPQWESDVAGVKVPLELVLPFDRKRDRWTGAIVYKRWLPDMPSHDLTSVETRPKPLPKWMKHNPPGILLCAIRGYLRDGKLTPRLRAGAFVFYTKRLALAPQWDYYDPCHSLLSSDGWRRWKSLFVLLNHGTYSATP